jgi:hypothetical protein
MMRPPRGYYSSGYSAFRVFGTARQENIGVFHSSCLKMAPKTPNASYYRGDYQSVAVLTGRPRAEGIAEALLAPDEACPSLRLPPALPLPRPAHARTRTHTRARNHTVEHARSHTHSHTLPL